MGTLSCGCSPLIYKYLICGFFNYKYKLHVIEEFTQSYGDDYFKILYNALVGFN